MRQKTIMAIQAHAAADYPREACGLIAALLIEWSPPISCATVGR